MVRMMKEQRGGFDMADVFERQEMEYIPEGPSHTESIRAHYLRFRQEDTIVTIRIPKDDFYSYSVTIDQNVG